MNGQVLGPTEALMQLQAKLFAKILKVASGVEKIEKSGYNKHQNYHYSTENDLINSVRNLLIENKLIVLTDSETKEVIKLSKADKSGNGTSESLVTVVNTRHTFCDTETGATYSIQSTGAGHDNTDKGVYKAITGSVKYFISKNFLVPTEDDPESDGVTKTATTAPKGFNRTATKTETTSAKISDNATVSVTTTTPENVSVKVEAEKPSVAPTLAAAKPGFGRRAAPVTTTVTAVKTEPKFP
jgi:hypothetical protein